VVVSTSWAAPEPLVQALLAADPAVVVRPRASDWGQGALAQHLTLVRSTLAAVVGSVGARSLVLVTVGHEVFVASALLRLVPRHLRPRLVVADFLLPRSRGLSGLQARLLRRVDAWACIRRGDVPNLATRFGIDPARCRWVAFPMGDPGLLARETETVAVPGATPGGGYLYSAGSAHRDWDVVLRALEQTGRRAVISVDPRHPDVTGRALPTGVDLRPPVSPEVGRSLTAAADLVVVSLHDTPLPAGPVVLIDALAMGKAVVATDANGCRDYVDDQVTGLLVPPGDAEALAAAIARLDADPALRARLGEAARRWCRANLQPADFAAAVLGLATAAAADVRAPGGPA
jgi:glycosyltransferase involved in cell wall biosynthesis